jgi:hypothetical protein
MAHGEAYNADMLPTSNSVGHAFEKAVQQAVLHVFSGSHKETVGVPAIAAMHEGRPCSRNSCTWCRPSSRSLGRRRNRYTVDEVATDEVAVVLAFAVAASCCLFKATCFTLVTVHLPTPTQLIGSRSRRGRSECPAGSITRLARLVGAGGGDGRAADDGLLRTAGTSGWCGVHRHRDADGL